MAVQRLRVQYGRTGDFRYVGHLDMMRFWQRALRRAAIAVACSEGTMPRVRLSIAAALPVGVTSEGELLDVYLKRRISPFYFMQRVGKAVPETVQIHRADDVPLDWPSLQSQVRQAEYRVGFRPGSHPAAVQAAPVQAAIDALLKKTTLPWEHQRDKEVRRYDLRELIEDVWLEDAPQGELRLGMVLKTDPSASGRPEQVAAALGLPAPAWCHRVRLILADVQEQRPPQRPPRRPASRQPARRS